MRPPPLNDATISFLEIPGASASLRSPPMSLDFDLQAFERPRIVHIAEAALSSEPRSITTAVKPRSAGGPHDFSSEGDYWWPDPANPAGPYLSRDGLTNPDNFVAHRQLLLGFVRDFGALAAAWRVSGD